MNAINKAITSALLLWLTLTSCLGSIFLLWYFASPSGNYDLMYVNIKSIFGTIIEFIYSNINTNKTFKEFVFNAFVIPSLVISYNLFKICYIRFVKNIGNKCEVSINFSIIWWAIILTTEYSLVSFIYSIFLIIVLAYIFSYFNE